MALIPIKGAVLSPSSTSDGSATDHEVTTLGVQNEILQVLKAILMGIEIISDQEEGTLIEDVDED